MKNATYFLGIVIIFTVSISCSSVKVLDTWSSDNEKIELDNIKRHMQENELFTDPDLNLKTLTDYLELSPKHLSYLINNYFNQNFMRFVNHYRIEKAKIRLKNPKEKGETIYEVMFDVGFNSKSSFNMIFKQHTGYTPSEFKKTA